ncbi:MAG: HlyC/CorC family transporter [Planctomycetes bacterium]|nr:HlyC/CorC family transporter [Planctomycetota bacterium]
MAYLILTFALAVNAFLALSEVALISSRKVRLEGLAEKGSRGAARALALGTQPTRFLSVIQAGITLVGIFAGAYGERSIATELTGTIEALGLSHRAADLTSTIGVILVIAFLSLVLGELVPKRLAMLNPEPLACAVSGPILVLSVALRPAVAALSWTTDALLRVLGAGGAKNETVTTEEIRGIIQQGADEGVIHQAEHQLAERVFSLGDLSVSGIMVPRTGITWLEADLPKVAVARVIKDANRSHYPVCEGDLEHPVGVVHVKDLAAAALNDEVSLRSLMRPPLYVPESMPVLRVMEEFRLKNSHIAFVLDEYGGLAGLITFNDIVENVMGRAPRPTESDHDSNEVTRADGSMLLDGLLPIARVREITETDELPKQDAGFATLAGLLMTNLGRIPRVGDVWSFGPHRFEVVDMDGRRVDRVLYQREAAVATSEPVTG